MKRWSDWLGIELNVVSGREKLVATLGGTISILLLILITESCLGLRDGSTLIASMGASAVLLFAVPHGQLSQPWPVLGGHCLSAVIGVACARWIPIPELAAAMAVGFSIGVMHQLKCIHPPGGATALTAVLGGEAVQSLGFHFVICPVLANGLVMVGVAVVFNLGFKWRRYPAGWHQNDEGEPMSANQAGHGELVAALRRMDLFVDLSEDDLLRLSRELSSGPDENSIARVSHSKTKTDERKNDASIRMRQRQKELV